MSPTNQVIVLCYEDHVEPVIARLLLKHRWTLVDGRNGPLAFKQIALLRPPAVVVAPATGEPAVGLVRRLAQHWNRVPILAVGQGGGDLELVMRQAGADCFLPSPIDGEELEAALELMVPGGTREGSRKVAGIGQGGDVAEGSGPYSRRSRRAH